MTTKTTRDTSIAPGTGTSPDPRARLEAQEIARGLADIRAGNHIDDDDLEAWLDQLEIDPDAPMPSPRPAAN